MLPDGIKFGSLYLRPGDEEWWILHLKVDNPMLDAYGRSLGDVYGYAEARTIAEAYTKALVSIKNQIQIRQSEGGRISPTKRPPEPTVDELASELGIG